MKQPRIRIICTAKQKTSLIATLRYALGCPFTDIICSGDGQSCAECLETNIDWETVEPTKDFVEFTVAELDKHCATQTNCKKCVYRTECTRLSNRIKLAHNQKSKPN